MRRRSVLLTSVLFVGILLGAFGSQVLGQSESNEQEPVVREELVREQLATAEGKEAIMIRAQLAPDVAMAEEPTIEHPAEEFVYVLEGSATLTREGDEPIQFSEGDSWYNDLAQRHTLKNASSSEPLTVLAVWIGDEGEF